MTVDLNTFRRNLHACLCRASPARKCGHEGVRVEGLKSPHRCLAKSLTASGELDAAIAEIAASDPDLDS